jgi:hypothetical protein
LREELYSADERLLPTDRAAVWRVEPAATVDATVLLDGIRGLDARRRAGELDPANYPTLLRALIARATLSNGGGAPASRPQDEVQVAKLVPQIPRA